MRMVSSARKATIVFLSVAMVAWCIHVKQCHYGPPSHERSLSVAKFIQDEQAQKATQIASPNNLGTFPAVSAMLFLMALTISKPALSRPANQPLSSVEPTSAQYPPPRFSRPPPALT